MLLPVGTGLFFDPAEIGRSLCADFPAGMACPAGFFLDYKKVFIFLIVFMMTKYSSIIPLSTSLSFVLHCLGFDSTAALDDTGIASMSWAGLTGFETGSSILR